MGDAGPSGESGSGAGALSMEATGIWERRTRTRSYGGGGAGGGDHSARPSVSYAFKSPKNPCFQANSVKVMSGN
jgi:hypothetical protein